METAAREMAEAGDVGGQPHRHRHRHRHRHSAPTRTQTGETQRGREVQKREAFVAEHATLSDEAWRTGAKIFFADEAHFRADAELRGKWVLKGEPAPRFHESRPWWTRPARAMAKRPATTRQCAWRPVRACPRESGGGVDGPGGEQQLRNLGCLPGAVAAEALRAARRDLGQRTGAPWGGGA